MINLIFHVWLNFLLDFPRSVEIQGEKGLRRKKKIRSSDSCFECCGFDHPPKFQNFRSRTFSVQSI